MSSADDVAKLVSALGHAKLATRVRAAVVLGQRREPVAVQALIAAIERGDDPELLAAAAVSLAKIGDPSAVPVLARLAHDAEPRARVEAVCALGRFDHPQALAALTDAASDTNAVVRREAARATRRLSTASLPSG